MVLDAEELKTNDPSRFGMLGMYVYISGFFQALLRHTSYDAICVPPSAEQSLRELAHLPTIARKQNLLTFIGEHELTALQQYKQIIFVTPSMDLPSMARLRRMSGCRRAPITGVIHSINHPRQLWTIVQHLLSPLHPFDAIICSSRAGHIAMTKFIDLVGTRWEKQGWPPLKASFQMPIIPLGSDTIQFADCSADSLKKSLGLAEGPVVLYFGRFSPYSKADLLPLILALREVRRLHPNVSLVLDGDDTYFELANTLRAIALEFVPESHLRVVPNPTLETKKELYALADIFVSPSDSLQETFGISLVEAMAAGLPAVVSDWNGYKDIVCEGETGFRIRTMLPSYSLSFDEFRGSGSMWSIDLLAATTMIDIPQLVSALSLLVRNPDRRMLMGQAAQRRARKLYDWTVVIAQYEKLWQDLTALAADPMLGSPCSGLDLDTFGYREVFAHYPTEVLNLEHHRIRLADRDTPWADHASLLRALEASWFRSDLLTSILKSMETLQDPTILTVLDELRPLNEGDRDLHLAHLYRLIKYGFIELCSGDR